MKTIIIISIIAIFGIGIAVYYWVQPDDIEEGTVDTAQQSGQITQDRTAPPAQKMRLIFIHHSCGENWLANNYGGLGQSLMDNNYFVSDTYYGWGPTDLDANDGGTIGDHTDIGYWPNWFLGNNSGSYLDALYNESDQMVDYARLAEIPPGENQIIMFKSCFPNSMLLGNPDDEPTTDDNPLYGQPSWSEHHTIANAKGIYVDLLSYFADHQDKLFIAITAPPVVENQSDQQLGVNARAFNNWLVDNWLSSYPHNNVAVFDFYNVLTSNGGDVDTQDANQEGGNHHRFWDGALQHVQSVDNNFSAYSVGADDSHPSMAGSQKATSEFVPLLNSYVLDWDEGI